MTEVLRDTIRGVTPPAARMALALVRRGWRDLVIRRPRFAVKRDGGAPLPHEIASLRQEIKRTAFFEGKRANIARGAALLDGLILLPGETFSFWRLIGRPSAAAGFATGRSIRAGAVSPDVGGGLCQLSGIAYEAGLRAGLTPVERFPHSRDIYAEADRFTPLGLDATVVWPYKDMRLANRLSCAVEFRFAVSGNCLTASVCAAAPVITQELRITRQDAQEWRDVEIARLAGDATEIVSRDRYLVAITPGSAPA